MASMNGFPARGKVVEIKGQSLVFHPAGTTYQLHLTGRADPMPQAGDRPINGVIRVRARKLWTVPSGGLFITPIFGTPRTIQGRVRYLDEREIVINAGTNVVVELPPGDAAIDLSNGPIALGVLVNVSAMPGASFEPLASAEALTV